MGGDLAAESGIGTGYARKLDFRSAADDAEWR